MKLNSFSLAAMVLVLVFGGVSLTSAMNWWQTESEKVPATYTTGEAAGQYNPADIRGSYTFGDVSSLFEVPLEDLQSAFRLPADADPATYPLKSLEALFVDLPVEMGTGSVRMFVAFYKGLPYEISADEETYLFPEAADVLKARGAMTAEQVAYLNDHIVPETAVVEETPAASVLPPSEPAAAAQPTAAPTEHTAPQGSVTGKTTFQDLLDWGVTKEEIESVLGEPMPAPKTVIKDHLTAKGLEFSSIKTELQAKIDAR